MNKPLFSIITVTLNNIAGLKKTYESLCAQSNQNFEWIIIDGVSTDGTIEFLNSQNLIHTSEPDNGIYDAMNKGISHVSGQYILFLNAGDTLASPETLEKINRKLDNQDYDFIYGDSLEQNKQDQTYKRARHHSKILHGMFTHHQAMLYSADILKDLRYNEKFKIAADYDLTLRTIKKSKNILPLNFPICIFEAGGISQQQVLKGRIEQFKIRMQHKIPLLKNMSIFSLQTLAYALRLICPKLYWFLKR